MSHYKLEGGKQIDNLIRFLCRFFLWPVQQGLFIHQERYLLLGSFNKLISSGFSIKSPHSFNIYMLIMSYPWALLGSSFLIFPTWSLETWNDSKSDLVWPVITDRSLLAFTRGVHRSTKYKLKRSYFFLISNTNLPLW